MTATTASPPVWLDRTAYPFRHHYIDLPAGRMHYVDEGAGEPLLFVHGTPSWPHEEAPAEVAAAIRAFLE